MQIDEHVTAPEEKEPEITEKVTIEEIANVPIVEQAKKIPVNTVEEQKDILPTLLVDVEPNMSILTDDNSIVETESVNLNYSDENKDDTEKAEDQIVEPMETGMCFKCRWIITSFVIQNEAMLYTILFLILKKYSYKAIILLVYRTYLTC